MGAIIDVLRLGEMEVALFRKRYPDCELVNLTDSGTYFQHYSLIVQDEDLDCYLYFLMENQLAVSSRNFLVKAESDQEFSERMRMAIMIKTNRAA